MRAENLSLYQTVFIFSRGTRHFPRMLSREGGSALVTERLHLRQTLAWRCLQ